MYKMMYLTGVNGTLII